MAAKVGWPAHSGHGAGQAALGHHPRRRGEWLAAVCLSVCLPVCLSVCLPACLSVCLSSPACLLCTLASMGSRASEEAQAGGRQPAGPPPAPPAPGTGLGSTDRWCCKGAPRSGCTQPFASMMGNWVPKGREESSGEGGARQGAPQSGGVLGRAGGGSGSAGSGAPTAAPDPASMGQTPWAPSPAMTSRQQLQQKLITIKKTPFLLSVPCGRRQGRQSSPACTQGHPGRQRHRHTEPRTSLPPALLRRPCCRPATAEPHQAERCRAPSSAPALARRCGWDLRRGREGWLRGMHLEALRGALRRSGGLRTPSFRPANSPRSHPHPSRAQLSAARL